MPSNMPPISADQFAAAIGVEADRELADAVKRIKHCLSQLSEEQVWWRESESQNSIANLVLHLCGNLRQRIVAGVGGAADTRNRSQEFTERGPIPKAELIQRLDQAARDASAAMAGLTAAELLRVRRIRDEDMTGLQAIFHTLPHFRGHTQEIIHMTRHLLGDAYQFLGTPSPLTRGGEKPHP